MRKLASAAAILMAGAAALATPALAQPDEPENWIVVGMQGGAMGWDTSTIDVDTEAGVTTVDRLIYFATPRTWDDHEYNYEGQSISFKCKDKQFQLVGVLFMEDDGFVFDGGAPEEPAWEPVEDLTPEGVLWAAVCNKATILKTKIYTDLNTALAGAKAQALPE